MDLGMTLMYYRDVVNSNELKDVLMRLKLINFFTLLVGCMELVLRKDLSCYKFKQIPTDDVKVFFKLLKGFDSSFVPVPERAFWPRVNFYRLNFKSYYSVLKYIPSMRTRFLKKTIQTLF